MIVNIKNFSDSSLPVCNSLFTSMSWSVLGHVLSEEQPSDGSDRVYDDGHLTIVQCHPYHQPPSLDLYWTSIGIHPLQYHQQIIILIIAITNQHHALSTAPRPEPHHAPHTFHVIGQSYPAHTSSRGHGRSMQEIYELQMAAQKKMIQAAGGPQK